MFKKREKHRGQLPGAKPRAPQMLLEQTALQSLLEYILEAAQQMLARGAAPTDGVVAVVAVDRHLLKPCVCVSEVEAWVFGVLEPPWVTDTSFSLVRCAPEA